MGSLRSPANPGPAFFFDLDDGLEFGVVEALPQFKRIDRGGRFVGVHVLGMGECESYIFTV